MAAIVRATSPYGGEQVDYTILRDAPNGESLVQWVQKRVVVCEDEGYIKAVMDGIITDLRITESTGRAVGVWAFENCTSTARDGAMWEATEAQWPGFACDYESTFRVFDAGRVSLPHEHLCIRSMEFREGETYTVEASTLNILKPPRFRFLGQAKRKARFTSM